MHDKHCIPRGGRRIEIAVSGKIDHNSVCGVFKDTVVELFSGEYEELVLDMRKCMFEDEKVLYRFYALLRVFSSTVIRRKMALTILYFDSDRKQAFLSRAAEFDNMLTDAFHGFTDESQPMESRGTARPSTVH